MALNYSVDKLHDHKVAIPWEWRSVSNDLDKKLSMWNDAAAWAIEHFGLPGDRYICRPTKAAIEFWFKDEADALLFTLKHA